MNNKENKDSYRIIMNDKSPFENDGNYQYQKFKWSLKLIYFISFLTKPMEISNPKPTMYTFF
jgi:hypothetical protein